MKTPTRRLALGGLLAAPAVLLAADEPRPVAPASWPTVKDQEEMFERIRLVALAETGGPPIPDDLPRLLALDVTRLLKEIRRRDRLVSPEDRP